VGGLGMMTVVTSLLYPLSFSSLSKAVLPPLTVAGSLLSSFKKVIYTRFEAIWIW
jgi:K+-transporting ATPase c subunit